MPLSRSKWMRRAAVAIASLALCAIGAEAAFWLGSTVAVQPAVAGRCAVLVLGYPSHADGSPNAVQRSRVAAGALAFANHHCERMVISGGAAPNASIEAAVMARLAIDAGVPETQIVMEDRAQNTWQNVEYALPFLEGFAAIFVASDALHAHRGRRYLCRQRPPWCDRVASAPAYEPLARPLWKIGAALYELHAWIRDRLVYD